MRPTYHLTDDKILDGIFIAETNHKILKFWMKFDSNRLNIDEFLSKLFFDLITNIG